MQTPSLKVVYTALGALVAAAAVVLGHTGLPTDLVGWLRFIGEVLAVAAAGGAVGYVKPETNPPAELVASIRAQAIASIRPAGPDPE